MPLYEYECDACHQRFEVIQKRFSDPAPDACARCGKGPVRRLLSTPAIQFKGSGWYITDYAGGRSNAASSTSATDGDAKSEAKADAKSDARKDSAKKDGEKKPAESAAKSDSVSSSGTGTTTNSASTTKD